MRPLIRSIASRPGFAAIILITLALDIGANTAVYSIAKAVVFTPLPFREPDAVVHLFEGSIRDRYQPGRENSFISVRGGSFHDWQERSRSFERIAASRPKQVILNASGRAVVADGFLAGEGLFEIFGVSPVLGRYFTVEDYSGDSRVVVLSHELWREQYNEDLSIVGQHILIDNVEHTVIGVMPAGFYPSRWYEPQFWLPLRWEPATKYSRVLWGLIVYGRLKHDVTLAEAQADMNQVAAQMREAYPADYNNMSAVVAPVAGYTSGHHERLFLLLQGAMALVLVIACANIANLLLARALERERDFAVRVALGASAGALIRQALAESLTLAGVGGLLGLGIAPLLTKPILALLPASGRIPRVNYVHIDAGVLGFTLLISVIVGVLLGLVPGLRAMHTRLASVLKEGTRSDSLGRRGRVMIDTLVIVEVALSLVLLAGGGLLVRTFLILLHSDPGFQPEHALALQLIVPTHRYGDYETGGRNASRERLFARLASAASAVPGVEAAAVTTNLPLRHGPNPWAISVEGRPNEIPREAGAAVSGTGLPHHGSVSIQRVTPGYFAALGIPLIRGRFFDEHDRPESPMVGVINETTARKYFRDEDPIGKRITLDMTSYFPRLTIVGIVQDSRLNGMDREVYPEVFWPMSFLPGSNAWIVVRTRAQPYSIAPGVSQAVRDVDPDLAITEVATMSGILRDSLWRQRLAALLVGLFAILAALIAMGGLYAVISYAVARRTRELGVRIAIGATRRHIAGNVISHGLRLTAIGVISGAFLCLVLNRWLASQIPSLATAPWMLPFISGAVLVLAVVACWVPARRALSVDPMIALRME
jgi:putative ABC transport system permease protein